MCNVHYSGLEIATTWWRQNGVVTRRSISIMRADGVRFLPQAHDLDANAVIIMKIHCS